MSNLKLLDPSQRLTIVDRIGADGSNGDSLSGQNVNEYPEGALFYVRASNRFYELRKNLDTLIAPNALENVVNGIGSSAVAGRFIAVQQIGTGALSGGTILIPGFDLTNGANIMAFYITPGGTQGFLRAAKTAANSLTVTSSQGADTSTVGVVVFEFPSEI